MGKDGVRNYISEKEGQEELKQTIIRTAATIFAQNGYENTSMNDIAAKANISRGPLYYYFRDKEDIFQHVFDYVSTQIEKTVSGIFVEQGTLFDKIEKEFYAICSKSYVEGEKIRDIVRMNPGFHQKAFQKLINSRKLVRYIKIHSVKQAIAQGEVKEETDPELLVNLLFVFYRGILSESAYWTEEEYDKKMHIFMKELRDLLQAKYGV